MTSEAVSGEATRASLSVEDGVAVIVMAGADGPNAIDEHMASQARSCVEEAEARTDVGAILTVADGPAWCVGGAIDAFRDAGEGLHEYIRAVGEDVIGLAQGLHESSKITVAAVHGAVVGGGVGLMAAHDIVLAARGTSFSLAYRGLGVTPDAGVTYFLVRDVGYRRALELYLTDDQLDAETARSLGLVTRVISDDGLRDEAIACAAAFAAGPREAQGATKQLFREAGDAVLARQLDDEIRRLADSMRSEDFAEGLQAYLDGRKPEFGTT